MTQHESPEAYALSDLPAPTAAAASQNACKLCTPLGATLVFKGIEGAVPLLHGSQGCSTYIRRYVISHFKEPMDIACSNFGEQTAIFGGGANLKLALDNIRSQYDPKLIGIATTCLSETIGDDVPMFIKAYRDLHADETLPPMVHVSTPSYRGTHMDGFHGAVLAAVAALAEKMPKSAALQINLFAGMLSPADLRHLKAMAAAFDLETMLLPDYSHSLDGALWESYRRVPPGGTPVAAIAKAGAAHASIELGRILAGAPKTAATLLSERCQVPAVRLGLPIGLRQTDALLQTLAEISGRTVPEMYTETRGRLLDALVDGHKHVNGIKAAVYGEEDLVAGLVDFLAEIGIVPVVCATGGGSGRFGAAVRSALPAKQHDQVRVLERADFVTIEQAVKDARPDLIIGHSKGYALSRRLHIPLLRVGFPIHDRIGGSRILHVGYDGALCLFDRIANLLIECRQDTSAVGYTYM
jgi:nitrogenase molybdenum-iron protein NifN